MLPPAEVLSNFGLKLVGEDAENPSAESMLPRRLVETPSAVKKAAWHPNGALAIETGSALVVLHDRFIVDTPDVHDRIAWGAVNRPLSIELRDHQRPVSSTTSTSAICSSPAVWPTPTATTRRLLVACERASQARSLYKQDDRLARSLAKLRLPVSRTFCVLAAPRLPVLSRH